MCFWRFYFNFFEIINLIMNKEYLSSFIPLIFLSMGVTFYSTQQVTLIGISIEKKLLS